MIPSPKRCICDICRNPIDLAHHEPALLTWKLIGWANEQQQRQMQSDFQIIHNHGDCPKRGGNRGQSPLGDFLNADFLMKILAQIQSKEISQNDGFEIIKRICIPGYDEGREHFLDAIQAEKIDPPAIPGNYSQDEIKTVLDWVAEGKPQ
jgi:hypothetical protein